MAADQRKRRLSVAPALGYGLSPEQSRAKKRGLRSAQYDFNFNSHVSLKWDDNGKRVVAKEDQIGISWRQLRSLVPTPPCKNNKLADILTVHSDVFQLNDLTGVLSFEVWESILTEKERGHLSQFLPQGMDPDQVVHALFSGDNFHFGNPFLEWGAKLCSGDLHPDAIVNKEKALKTTKKDYYSELEQYHHDMIMNLQHLKERCMRSKYPEAEILQMMSRSRRHAEKSVFPDTNGVRSLKHEDAVAPLSESLSSLPDEKLYNSDNQKLSAIRDAEIQKRIHYEEVIKDKHEKLVVLPKLKKAEKLQKAIYPNDGAKYMSYVKISKKQHELVKSMKQSGSSIQSRTLNRVLGNLNSFNVKPYEMFGEEEQKRIYEYWSNLANNDIPTALQNWRNRQSEREQMLSTLLHEVEEKVGFISEDERLDKCDLHSEARDEKSDVYDFHVQVEDDNSDNPDEETIDPEETDSGSSRRTSEQEQEGESVTQSSSSDDDGESNPSSTADKPLIQNPLNLNQDLDHPAVEDQCSLQKSPSVDEEVHILSMENHSSMRNSTSNVNEKFIPMDLNAENNFTKETTETSRTPPSLQVTPQTCEASLDISHPRSHASPAAATAVNAEGIPYLSAKNVWASIGLPESYHPPPTTQYVPSSEPSFRHQQFVPNQPASLIDLESDSRENDTTKDLLNRHPDHMAFCNNYPNRDRTELLQSLIKHDSYHESKKTGLEFHPTSSVLLEPTQFACHFREQMQPSFALHSRPKVQGELFMNHQNIQDGTYSDSRYPIHFPSLNVGDWTNTRLPTPIQSSQLSSREPFSQNWFAGENRAHGSWSTSDSTAFSSPSLGSGSGGDQSLYSVLTQCNTLHSRASYRPVGSTEQIISQTSYGQDIHGEIPMTNNSSLPQTASPFDYLSGNEAAAASTMQNTNMGWMSLGHQTPGLQDQTGRPFIKPWNQ